jgi:pimeloyl-ACP methyl ester carboxylesterase
MFITVASYLIVRISAAGQRTSKLVKGAELVSIQGGPHNVAWTHSEEVNRALLQFLAKSASGKQIRPQEEAVA